MTHDPAAGGPPARTRRSPRGEMRRAQILEAAVEEFARHGYRAATLEVIAQRAEISQAGLLHHYPSKEALFHAVLESLLAEGSKVAASRVVDDPCDGPLSYFRALTEDNMAHEDRMRLIALVSAEGLGADHPAGAIMRQRYVDLRERATARILEQQESGAIDGRVDASRVGALVLAVLDGMQLQWLYSSDADFLGVLEEFERLLEPRDG